MKNSCGGCTPLLRWAGSKRRQLRSLVALAPLDFARYYEPFAGSACLFFALSPPVAVIGDRNRELIDFYSVLRRRPRGLFTRAATIPGTRRSYYAIRRIDPKELVGIERAARFLFLNRHCFNGIYRTNNKGYFNVPFGDRAGRMPTEMQFIACARALRAAELRAQDFEESTTDVRAGDFVYLDPPFFSPGRPARGEYGYGSFSTSDHARFGRTLRTLADRGAKIMVSASLELAERLQLRSWTCSTLEVLRTVAARTENRRRGKEAILRNY